MNRTPLLVTAAISLAGCYSPSLDACALACAANNACPDGLACNAQGLCAASASDTCTFTDASVDGPGNPRQMTIEVRDRRGDPQPGVTVLFSDADGAMLGEVMTNGQGLAQMEMDPGGMASVVRMSTLNGGNQTFYGATTFLDLPAGAHMIAQPEIDLPAQKTIRVSWTPAPTASTYEVLSSCGNAPSVQGPQVTSMDFNVPSTCTTVDVVVMASASMTQKPMIAYAAAQTGNSVQVGAWQPLTPMTARLSGRPTNASINVALGWYITPSLTSIVGLPAGQYDASTGVISNWDISSGIGAVPAFRIENVDPNYPGLVQTYGERLPIGATSYGGDLTGKLLDYVQAPAIRLPTRRFEWQAVPPGVQAQEPDAVTLSMSFNRNNTVFLSWRLIAPGTSVQTDGANSRWIDIPEIATSRTFQPLPGDAFQGGGISLYGIPDALRRPFISRLEQLQSAVAIPGLDAVTTIARDVPPPQP